MQTSDAIAKQSRTDAAENDNEKITSIAHGQRWSVLNENSIPDQTAADSANQRDTESNRKIFTTEREIGKQVALCERNPELFRNRRRPAEKQRRDPCGVGPDRLPYSDDK